LMFVKTASANASASPPRSSFRLCLSACDPTRRAALACAPRVLISYGQVSQCLSKYPSAETNFQVSKGKRRTYEYCLTSTPSPPLSTSIPKT
jgi:hypothetical protein